MTETDEKTSQNNKNVKSTKTSSNFGCYISLGITVVIIIVLLCTVSYKIATTERISKFLETHCNKGFCLEVDLGGTLPSSSVKVTLNLLTNNVKELVAIGVQTIIVKNLAIDRHTPGNTEEDIQLFVKTTRFRGIGFFIELNSNQLTQVNNYLNIGAHGFLVKFDSTQFSASKMKDFRNIMKSVEHPVEGKIMLEFETKSALPTISNTWKTISSEVDLILIPITALFEGNSQPDRDFYSSKDIIYTSKETTSSQKLFSILVSSFYKEGAVINQNDLFLTSTSNIIFNDGVANELKRLYKLKTQFSYYRTLGNPVIERLSATAGGTQNEFYILRQNNSTSKTKYKSFIIIYSSVQRQINLKAKHGNIGDIIYEYPSKTTTNVMIEELSLDRIQLTRNSIIMIGLKT